MSGFFNEFADMMIFEVLICNTDRHISNYGLLVDNKTNKSIWLVLVFDNELSSFNFEIAEDLKIFLNKQK